MISFYNPYNWFWIADDNRVFGSQTQTISDNADPDYLAWTEAGNLPTVWPRDAAGNQTVESLQEVLTPYDIFIDLVAYAANARYRHASGGLTVSSISAIPFYSDPVARNTLANAYEHVKSMPGSSIDWKLSDGSFVTLDEAALSAAVTAMSTFVQSCFTCESETQDNIGSGTITTHAQVDAAFAAVPNVVP